MTRVSTHARTLLSQPWHFAALALVFMTLAVIVATSAGAAGGSLLVTPNADRSGATALDGGTVSGPAHIFLSTADDVQRVVFSLDGSDIQVENISPYDLLGGNQTYANTWSSASVADGTHTVSALVSLVGGGEFTVSATFTVDNTPDPVAATASLLVSSSANRSGSAALGGATLSGEAFVFLTTDANATSVTYSLDGAQTQVENISPFDFRGGTASTANVWDTTSVEDGAHVIDAVVRLAGGGQFSASASFIVDNGDTGGGSGDGGVGEPTATPAPQSNGSLLVSNSANRSGASALGAESLQGNAYVFLTSPTSLSQVRFRLDGVFMRTENLSPFDMGGTITGGSAGAWNTTSVDDGAHVIEATATAADGSTFTVSASFIVDNDPSEGGDSEVSTTSTDSSTTRSIEVFVSSSPNRGGAQVFGIDAVTGEIYLFAVPNETPDRVRFYIDPDQQPLPARTEQLAPYDLGGTQSGGAASPFDLGGLDEGDHTLLVVAEFADGDNVTKTVDFNVEQPEVLPELDYALQVSDSANRSGATALNDAVLEGDAYIFVSPADHVTSATFYLDDPAQTSADRTDSSAPFDLVGGSASTAQPFDVGDLSPGTHVLTVVLTRADATTTEVTSTFSLGGTDVPPGAVLIETSDNAAQVASQHGAGTVFYFEAGVHRGVSINPQSGDVFIGAPGATLNGAKVLSNWNAGSGYWYAGGQSSELTGAGGCKYNDDGSRYDSCHHPEQVFVDGAYWWQVSSISQLGYGKWYFDYASDRVYLGANPAGHTVELSVTPYAFSGSASDVTISGLTIEKYANRAQTGAIHGGSTNRWTVSGNVLRYNHGFGLRVGQRMQVLNNNVHHNGQVGMGGIGDDVLVQGNEIAYNNAAGFLVQWEAGGTKFVLTDGLVFRDNWVHHNDGRGFWTDIENINVLVEDNLVEYNSWSGIAHEIGYSAIFRNNVSRYNGYGFGNWVWGAQILIQNSSNVVVTGNDVTVAATGEGNGITVVNQSRGNGTYGPYRSDHVTVTGNTIRHLGTGGRNGAPNGCNQDNTFNNNTYIAPANYFNGSRFEWCGLWNFNTFQNKGQEANATVVITN